MTDSELPPDPPVVWGGQFLARYPDGSEADFTLGEGHTLRAGDSLPGTSFVLDHWETSPRPHPGVGKHIVIGVFREAD